jgi:hypothetical protein
MTSPYPDAEKLRAEFDARWKAAIERPTTNDAVHPESVPAPVTLETFLSRLGQVAKACVAEGLITPEEGERVAASADEIRQIMGGIDPAKVGSVARQLR